MTLNRLIIGVHGHLGVGKTTAARRIAYRLDARRRSLVDPIIEIAIGFGISAIEMREHPFKDQGLPWLGGTTPRQFAKRVGRGCRRAFGDDFFAQTLIDRVMHEEDVATVVDNVRLLAEVDAFDMYDLRDGGNPADLYTLQIHIERPGYEGDAGDETEIEVDQANPARFCATLINDGTIADLERRVDDLLEQLRFAYPLVHTLMLQASAS